MEEINWNTLLLEVDLPDFGNILDNEPEPVTEPPPQPCSTQNPDEEPAVSSWIGEVEKVLMEDDNFDHRVETQPVSDDDFLADLLVDSPPSSGGDVAGVDGADMHKQSQTHTDVDKDDPIAKKQRRQLRNRDAAARSRERKKMYVKDLEMKSRYLEGECSRLSRVLQCFIAENQALRLTLHKGCAFDASSAKQESAVLLLGMKWFSMSSVLAFTVFGLILYGQESTLLIFTNGPCYSYHSLNDLYDGIPAVGFPALVPGHHVPLHPANTAQVSSGDSSNGKRGNTRSRKTGSKRGRE